MTTELTGSGIRIDVATRGLNRSVMTFSSRLARVRITGSSFAPLPTGGTDIADVAVFGLSFVWPEAISSKPRVQIQTVKWCMLFPFFSP